MEATQTEKRKIPNKQKQLQDSVQEGVLAGYPDLAGKLADASLLTPESTRWSSNLEVKGFSLFWASRLNMYDQ